MSTLDRVSTAAVSAIAAFCIGTTMAVVGAFFVARTVGPFFGGVFALWGIATAAISAVVAVRESMRITKGLK